MAMRALLKVFHGQLILNGESSFQKNMYSTIIRYIKNKMFIVLLALIGVVGVGVAFAGKISLNPELNILQKFAMEEGTNARLQEKISGIRALEEEESRLRAGKYISLEEQAGIIEDKARGHEEQLKRVLQSPTINATDTNQFVGILEGVQVPAPFSSEEFKVINYWGGEVGGRRAGVYAGYFPQNPSQGALAVFESKDDVRGHYYNAPDATGPLRIISEANGILVVMSIKGEFERYNALHERVHTPGLTIYRFDMKSGVFK